MPVQDLIDQIDKGLEGLNVAETPTLPVLPVREPAVQAPTLRDDEADLLSWAENFSSNALKVTKPVSDDARVGREKAVRTFAADVPAASGSTFGRNISKGVLNIGETSLGFFESLTDILGASKAKSWLKEKGDRLDELNRAIPNEIESFTDVEDAGDAGAFLAMAIGQFVPQVVPAIIGGVGARALTAGASAGAKLAGTFAGTVVPSTILESGGIYRGVRDETGVEAPVTSLTFGAIAGALEAVTPSRFLLKVFDTGTDELKRKSLASLLKLSAREILKETGEAGVRVGKAAAKTGLTELGTEIAQEGIALGANKFADGTYDLINSQNAVRLIDAGLMGLVGGAALGSVEPSIERAIKYTRQQEDQNAANERQKQTDVEQERGRIDADLQAEREDRERETALAQARATSGVSDQLPQVGTVQEVTPPVVAPPVIESKRGAIPASQITTPEFKAWFGDSKVVDESGRPVVVYKGMYPYDYTQETETSPGPEIAAIRRPSEFPAFNRGEPGINVAGFFGDRDTASRFATGMQGAVYPVFLSLQSPLVIDAGGKNAGDIQFGESGRPFRDEIRSGKYDGAVIKNTKDEGTIYVALRSEQIKSAVSNTGAFSSLNPDMRGAIGQSTPTPPIPPVPSTGVAAVAFDIPAFKQRVAASNLSPEAKSFIDAFLNSKAAKYLEGARFRIAEALDGGWEGSYFKGLVAIAETATPGVAPQEFMHRIFDLLPEADKRAIEALRQERLAELSAQYPNDPLLASIAGGPMTTANFVAANPTDQQISDLYPVTTTDEFFAHMMSDKFVARTKGGISRGFISTIREAIKDLVAAIKKGFRLPVTADEMFRNVINGRYDVTPDGGASSEQRRGTNQANAPELTDPATGQPKVFYHGTYDKFDGQLRPGTPKDNRRGLHEEGIWFASNRGDNFDSSWPSDATRYSGDHGMIVSATLSIKRPYYGSVNELFRQGINAAWLRQNGHDGFIDKYDGSGLVVVLDPSQITEVGREKLKDVPPWNPKTPEGYVLEDGKFVRIKDASIEDQRRGAVVPITRQKTIERVAAFAKPGAERQTEALLATGQVTSPRNILSRFLSTVPSLIQDRVGRLVGFERMDAISTYVRDVLGQSPTEYAAARATLTDDGLKNLLAVHTNRAFELFEQNAAKLKALLARQQKKLTSPAWASKLRDLAKKRSKADATAAAREAMQLALKNGLDRAVKRIQESGGNDATFESAEQERKFYEQLLSRSPEVLSSMEEIANMLGFYPDGTSVMFGKGSDANAILTEYYKHIPRPPTDRMTGLNEKRSINRVAAEILARNVILRQQMVAALWAENAALAKPIATFEDQVVRDMQAGNPKTVIGKLIRQAGDLSNTEGKAAAAFMAKYRELLREVEKLEALEEAVRVVDATLVDKQYRAVRVQVATDAKAEIRPQDAKALETGEAFYSTSHIYLPDGTIVELNMFPDKARFQDELTRKLDPALTAINKWLFDTANLDHPARAFYQQQYDTFKALWWSSTAVNPPKQLVIFRNTVFKMLDSMLGMLDPMLGSIGTRSTTLAQTAGQVWKDANHQMGDWLARWNPLIVDSMARAAKSHPAIWEGQSRGAATDEWHSSVFVPLAASVQDPARPGYKVGNVIYESGEVVTQQDMDALELQVAATGASFKIDLTVGRKGLALPNVVEDRFVPGLKFLRRPIAFAKNMMMRRFDNSGRDIGIAFVALKEKIAGQPTPAQRAALERFWDDHFQYVKSAVVNRNAQYSNLTEFEDILAAARPEISNGSISNVAELVDFIFGRTLEDPDVIANWLFGELDRHAAAIHKATATKADLGILDIATVEDQNPFTVGRGGEIAPPAWYSYGFNDSRSIYNFSMSGSNFYFEILIKSLNAVSADLGAEISRQGTAIDALATKLGKGKEAQARQIVNRQNQDDIRLGRQTFDLETAADMKRGLDKLILNLNQRFSPGGRRLEEEFGIANKVWGDFISGVLFSSYTLARNALEGGFIQNGFRMSRLFGSTLQGFPRAFLGLMQTFLKVGGAGLWSLPVAAFKLRPIAGARALLTGNVLKAEQTFFGDAIRELATNMFERVQMFRDLEAAGLGMPSYPAETVQASAQYPLTFGQIVKESPMAETPFGRLLQNIGPGLLTFYDAQISLFLRPFFPRVGDQIANLAVANTTLGGIHNLEARLRKLFSVYRAAGVPVASLSSHVFTPSEILGKWFGIERTQTSLREIQQWFHKSLISFNDSVFDYLTRLEKDPKAVWLTHEEKMRLITTNAEAVNVATPLNRPELFKRNLPMRMVGGLLGWNVSALRNAVNNFTAVAASDPNFSRNQLRLATYTMFLATLAYSALGQAGIEEILRFLSWMLNNEERATRQPWEQEGADQAKQWAVYAFNSIPFVATAVNTAFSDLPNKAGFSPTLLAQQKVIDVLNYISGAIRTRDITYRLPQLVRGFNPLSPVVMNRLPAVAGSIEAMNASRLYRRYGDLDLIRRSTGGPGVSATATRLTPYGDRILNALAQGDYESAEALKAEAVKVATQLGKPDPERSVEQSIVSRLPHRRAFKETPNAVQMARVMSKMSSSERAQVTQLNNTLKTGLDRMGIKTDFVDQPRLTDAPRSRLAGGGLRLDRPRRGRRSRLIGLSNRRSRTSSRLRSRTRRRRRLSAFA